LKEDGWFNTFDVDFTVRQVGDDSAKRALTGERDRAVSKVAYPDCSTLAALMQRLGTTVLFSYVLAPGPC
jgi:hypothetical protein